MCTRRSRTHRRGLYSGSFLISAEVDQIDQTRLVAGIQPEGFSWQLCPGEVFTAPEVLLSYSAAGLGRLSRQLHSFLNNHIIHGVWAKRRRPVLLNSWEAAYFDFDDDKLVEFLKASGNLEFIKTEEKPKWGEYKKRLEIMGGSVVDKETGEIVDGVKAIEKPDTFSVDV